MKCICANYEIYFLKWKQVVGRSSDKCRSSETTLYLTTRDIIAHFLKAYCALYAVIVISIIVLIIIIITIIIMVIIIDTIMIIIIVTMIIIIAIRIVIIIAIMIIIIIVTMTNLVEILTKQPRANQNQPLPLVQI